MNRYNRTRICLLLILVFCSHTLYGQPPALVTDTLRNIHWQKVTVTATQSNAPGTSLIIGQGLQFDPLPPPLNMRNLRTRSYRDYSTIANHFAKLGEHKQSFAELISLLYDDGHYSIEEEREDSATVFLNKVIAQYRERVGNNSSVLFPGIFLPVQASYASLLHRNGKLQQAQKAFSTIEPLMKETTKEPTQLKLQIDALVRYSALCHTQGKAREALNLLVHKDSIREIYDAIRKEQDSRNQLAIFQSNELIHKNEIQKKELDNSERINCFYLFSGTIISLLLAGYIWGTSKLRNKMKQLLKENTSLKETLQGVPKTTTKGKKETETKYISPKSRELFARAEQEVKAKKLFLNQKLRITDLARTLETNSTTLSECINVNAGVRFNDWVNEFRIQYITKRLNNTSQIEKLYKEAGFASQSTFYASFKKEKGCTPTEHLRNQDA